MQSYAVRPSADVALAEIDVAKLPIAVSLHDPAAGVPRQAEVIVFADDVAEVALGYCILRLMCWPNVKVWLRD